MNLKKIILPTVFVLSQSQQCAQNPCDSSTKPLPYSYSGGDNPLQGNRCKILEPTSSKKLDEFMRTQVINDPFGNCGLSRAIFNEVFQRVNEYLDALNLPLCKEMLDQSDLNNISIQQAITYFFPAMPSSLQSKVRPYLLIEDNPDFKSIGIAQDRLVIPPEVLANFSDDKLIIW